MDGLWDFMYDIVFCFMLAALCAMFAGRALNLSINVDVRRSSFGFGADGAEGGAAEESGRAKTTARPIATASRKRPP